MKLSKSQQAQLEQAGHTYEAHREIKRNAEAEVRKIVAERVATSHFEVDRQIRLAVAVGVPKKKIYEHLRMSPNAVYESLARTEESAEVLVANEPKPVERFAWADDAHEYLRITLAGAEWEALKATLAPNVRKNHDADSGTYPLSDAGELIPRTDWQDKTTPNKFDHPVSAWLSFHGGLAEAQSWIDEQKEEAE